MNEIELAKLADQLEQLEPVGERGILYASKITQREAELLNIELERRGAPTKVVAVKSFQITKTEQGTITG